MKAKKPVCLNPNDNKYAKNYIEIKKDETVELTNTGSLMILDKKQIKHMIEILNITDYLNVGDLFNIYKKAYQKAYGHYPYIKFL